MPLYKLGSLSVTAVVSRSFRGRASALITAFIKKRQNVQRHMPGAYLSMLSLLAVANGFVAPMTGLHQLPVQPAFAAARPALRTAVPTAKILSYTGAETAGRVMRYLKGAGVSPERVPCGDGDDEECYALCDKEGCSVVGEVRKSRPPTVSRVLFSSCSDGTCVCDSALAGRSPEDRQDRHLLCALVRSEHRLQPGEQG